MAWIETYSSESAAKEMRDYYNHQHEPESRAVLLRLPIQDLRDYGGGGSSQIFVSELLETWIVVVELTN